MRLPAGRLAGGRLALNYPRCPAWNRTTFGGVRTSAVQRHHAIPSKCSGWCPVISPLGTLHGVGPDVSRTGTSLTHGFFQEPAPGNDPGMARIQAPPESYSCRQVPVVSVNPRFRATCHQPRRIKNPPCGDRRALSKRPVRGGVKCVVAIPTTATSFFSFPVESQVPV